MQVLRGISAAARELEVSEGTMRSLEKRGLIRPIRDTANRRLYSDADMRAARESLRRYQVRKAAA